MENFFCLPLLVLAKHENIKGFEIKNCKECTLNIRKRVVLHTDGEYGGDVRNVRFECISDKLRLML